MNEESACDGSQVYASLPTDKADEYLALAFHRIRRAARSWAADLMLSDLDGFRAFLARESTSTTTDPLPALIAVVAIENAPELAQSGLLRRLVEAPPAGSTVVHFAAFDRLADRADPDDVEFLDGVLESEDGREVRRAFRALAHSPVGPAFVRDAVLEDVEVLERLDSSNLAEAFDVPEVLSDEGVVLACLRSQSPSLVDGMLMALGTGKVAPSSAVLDAILEIRNSATEDRTRGNARQVYGRWSAPSVLSDVNRADSVGRSHGRKEGR